LKFQSATVTSIVSPDTLTSVSVADDSIVAVCDNLTNSTRLAFTPSDVVVRVDGNDRIFANLGVSQMKSPDQFSVISTSNSSTTLSATNGVSGSLINMTPSLIAGQLAGETRLFINPTQTGVYAPDGTTNVTAKTGELSYYVDGVNGSLSKMTETSFTVQLDAKQRLTLNNFISAIFSPDQLKSITSDNTSSLKVLQSGIPRIDVKAPESLFSSQNQLQLLRITDTYMDFRDTAIERLGIFPLYSQMKSKDGNSSVYIQNDLARLNVATVPRVEADATKTRMTSPNNNEYIEVTDTGLFLKRNTIARQKAGHGLFNQIDSNTRTGTGEQQIDGTVVGSKTFPANTFLVGDGMHLKLGGLVTIPAASTIQIRVYGGIASNVLLLDTGAIVTGTTSGKVWEFECDFTVRSLGGAGVGSIVTNGSFNYTQDTQMDYAGFSAHLLNNTTFYTDQSNVIRVTVEFSNGASSIITDMARMTQEY